MPTSESQNFVTAIIVSHDGAIWLPEVIAALTKQKLSPDQIISVDTGSTDGSVKLLKSAGYTPISIERNASFGSAINAALEHSRTKRAPEGVTEWIWLIHDDCAPAATALYELIDSVSQRPNVAMAGPKLRGWHDRSHLLEIGVSIAPNGARWTGLETFEKDQGQHDDVSEVLAVSTAGALIRRDYFEEIGGIDPDLGLFRDDVDLGWRLHAAGHNVIVVPRAVAYHAEASANERRSIDVSDAFLHRPLLLDRRNAAYVLMANATWWLTPLIALQLLGSALFRSIGFLLAKLPGYALDELGAVVLLLLKPGELLSARRQRKKTRLVSSRVIARFIPPRSAQFMLALEKGRDAISRAWQANANQRKYMQKSIQAEAATSRAISSLDLNDEALEDADIDLTRRSSLLRSLIERPLFATTLLVTMISLIAFRGRWSDLVGGALPRAPQSGLELLRTYAEAWHPVALGSSVSMPPWIAIMGVASIVTLGNLKLLISILFVGAVPFAFLGAYRLVRRFTELRALAIAAALLYAFSPVSLTSLNSGRLGTVMLLTIGPWLIRPLLQLERLEALSWRRTWWLAILHAIVCAFSPLTFIVIMSWQIGLFLIDLFAFTKSSLTKEEIDARNLRRIAFVATPIVLWSPWSIEFIIHPSRLLLDPGLNLSGGSVVSIAFGNPGGIGSPPLLLLSPLLLVAVIGLFVSKTARFAEVALFFTAIAAVFGSRQVIGHGSFKEELLWVGSLLVIATLASILVGVVIIDKYVPEISLSHFDFRHILLFILSVIAALSFLTTTGWWVATATKAPLQSFAKSAVPAFLAVSGETDERFKTLVINTRSDSIKYFIARDRDLQFGDPDVTVGLVDSVDAAVVDIATGIGVDSSQVLAEFGIRYLFMSQPVDENLVRTIDGLGGFTRAASTSDGISWKVQGALGHVAFLSSDGTYSSLRSGAIGATGELKTSGSIIVTEKFHERWKLLLNGKYVQATETENGTPRFIIDQPGDFILFFDGTSRRAWISWQVIVAAALIVFALPARRRRKEMRLEELA